MNKSKLIWIFIAVILIFGIITITVNAASSNSFKAKLVFSKSDTYLEAGEVIDIKLKLSDINMGNGIMALSGKLVFDEKVFEVIKADNAGIIKSNSPSKLKYLSNGGSPTYAMGTKKFALDLGSYVKSPTDVLLISLKVKSNISVKQTTVKVVDFVTSNGIEDVDANDMSIVIKAKKKIVVPKEKESEIQPEAEVKLEKEKVKKTVDNSNKTVKKVAKEKKTVDNTVTKTEKLPYTGMSWLGYTFIIVFVVIAIVTYKKYNCMKDIK